MRPTGLAWPWCSPACGTFVIKPPGTHLPQEPKQRKMKKRPAGALLHPIGWWFSAAEMRLMRNRLPALLLLLSSFVFAQAAPQQPSSGQKAPPPANNAKPADNKAVAGSQKTVKPDRGAAYYPYSLAHIYEELVSMYGRSEFVSKAI